MIEKLKEFLEFLWLYFKGFRPVEFVRGDDRISLHPFGWRANGTGRMKRAKDAVSYLDSTDAEQWRQIYCGMTPFLVSDRGNVKHIDGKPAKLLLSNGRYQVLYKPEDSRGRGRNGRDHKKRVYRSMLVAMAFLDFKKGDDSREIHHVNGYRTDDRLANLVVLTHEEHTRIHNMGPCGLSGTRDEALALLAEMNATDKTESQNAKKSNPEVTDEPESSPDPRPENEETPNGSSPTAAPSKRRRRGRRGGRRRRATEAPSSTAQEAADTESSRDSSTTETPKEPLEISTAPEPETFETRAASIGAPLSSPLAEGTNPLDKGIGSGEDDSIDAGKGTGSGAREHSPSARSKTAAKSKAAPQDKAPSCAEVNWADMRSRLEEELGSLLETCTPGENGEFPTEKNLTKRCKPVYRALRPYQTCPDAVAQFDTALACIRTIVRTESEWGKTGPSPLQSLLGELHQLLKSAVKRLAAGDELERMCTEELLREELDQPVYAKSSSARKLRQCLSIACSKKEREGLGAEDVGADSNSTIELQEGNESAKAR